MGYPKLDYDDQLKIYRYLFGDINFGIAYISPIPEDVRGKKDNFNSFNIYKTAGGNIRWKDFGGGGLSGDAIDILIIMRDGVNNYYDAVRYYNKNIKNSRFTNEKLFSKSKSLRVNLSPVIEYDTDYSCEQIDYFYKGLITESDLIAERIFNIVSLDWGKGDKMYYDNPDEPTFVYDLYEDMTSWKIYSPLAKHREDKWKSWNTSRIPYEGYELLENTGDILVITSSKKDGLVMKKAFNVSCINPLSESSWKKILPEVANLNSRFKDIYICFDNDKAGIKASSSFSDYSNFKELDIEYPENTKDIFEIVTKYDYDTLIDSVKFN